MPRAPTDSIGVRNLAILHEALQAMRAVKKGKFDDDAREAFEKFLGETISTLKANAETPTTPEGDFVLVPREALLEIQRQSVGVKPPRHSWYYDQIESMIAAAPNPPYRWGGSERFCSERNSSRKEGRCMNDTARTETAIAPGKSKTTSHEELAAIAKCCEAFEGIDASARNSALHYLIDKYMEIEHASIGYKARRWIIRHNRNRFASILY